MSTANDPFLFLKKFVRHGTRVASFAPSSPWLAAAMCRELDPTRPQTIVELGAGTGAVTTVAAERLHPDSRLFAFELDAEFAAICQDRCPRAEVICGDVRDLAAQLAQRGVASPDVVLSGLPVPSLPRPINEAVFGYLATLPPTVWFSQLTLMPWVYLKLYRGLFELVDFEVVLRSLPPGGVYHCRSVRADFAAQLPQKG